MMRVGHRKPQKVILDQWDGTEHHAEELIKELNFHGVEAHYIPGFYQLVGNTSVPIPAFLAFNGYNLRPGDYLVKLEDGRWTCLAPAVIVREYDLEEKG